MELVLPLIWLSRSGSDSCGYLWITESARHSGLVAAGLPLAHECQTDTLLEIGAAFSGGRTLHVHRRIR
jgi:hypothetical protein